MYEKYIGILINSSVNWSQQNDMGQKDVGGGRNLKAALVLIHLFIHFYLKYTNQRK